MENCIKVVTKMTIVQIRTPSRVKQNVINSHELGPIKWQLYRCCKVKNIF